VTLSLMFHGKINITSDSSAFSTFSATVLRRFVGKILNLFRRVSIEWDVYGNGLTPLWLRAIRYIPRSTPDSHPRDGLTAGLGVQQKPEKAPVPVTSHERIYCIRAEKPLEDLNLWCPD